MHKAWQQKCQSHGVVEATTFVWLFKKYSHSNAHYR